MGEEEQALVDAGLAAALVGKWKRKTREEAEMMVTGRGGSCAGPRRH